jgi:secreted trypsin-like serine protease
MGGTLVTEKNPLASGIVGIYDVEARAICTGSIISEEFVLTAAHCAMTKPRNLRLIFGVDMDELIAAREQDIVQMFTRQVVSLKVHPKYDDEDVETLFDVHDIAILKFRGGLPEGYRVVKILEDDRFLRRGMTFKIAGYGVNEVISVPVDPKKVKKLEEAIEYGEVICDDDLKDCLQIETSGDGLLRETTASLSSLQQTEFRLDESKGQGSCSGDSGGPAYINKDGVDYLVGVTSRGDVLCDSEGVYTNVVAFRDWIQETIRALK